MAKRLSDTEAIVAQPMRPPCFGEPNAGQPLFMPIEDKPYRDVHGRRETGVGEERFRGARCALGAHYGVAKRKD